MYQYAKAVSSIILQCCTKRTGYLKCGEKLLKMNWSLEGRKKKCKAQKCDYTFHVSPWEMKFSFKKQPKGISLFHCKTRWWYSQSKRTNTSLFSTCFPSLMKTKLGNVSSAKHLCVRCPIVSIYPDLSYDSWILSMKLEFSRDCRLCFA